MPKMTIGIADLGDELRMLPKRDRIAVTRGIHRTLSVDAYRWFDWSLRGGGFGGAASAVRPGPKPKKPKKPKPSVGLLRRLVTRLKGLMSMFKLKKPSTPLKPPDPCDYTPPPAGYRPPIDQGDYANSGRHDLTDEGGIFYSDSSPPIKAGVIEHGRRPAPIPIEPLADWVRRKLGCNDPDRSRSIAIAISKAAAKTPRPGLKVFERMHPKIVDAAKRNVEREMRKMKPGMTV